MRYLNTKDFIKGYEDLGEIDRALVDACCVVGDLVLEEMERLLDDPFATSHTIMTLNRVHHNVVKKIEELIK